MLFVAVILVVVFVCLVGFGCFCFACLFVCLFCLLLLVGWAFCLFAATAAAAVSQYFGKGAARLNAGVILLMTL